MTYLIFTKKQGADWQDWGIQADHAGLTVDKSGIITPCERYLPENEQVIAVLSLKAGLSNHIKVEDVKGILGNSPRMWAHYGGERIESIDPDWVVRQCQDSPYLGFKEAFGECPMPYSHSTGSVPWDTTMQALAEDVKNALDNQTVLDINAWLEKLDNAWAEAEKRFKKKDLDEAGQNQARITAAQTLLPIHIYCDGLAYAQDKDPSKTDSMIKLMRYELPRLNLPASFKDGVPGRDEIIESIKWLDDIKSLSDADLSKNANAFREWYKVFLLKIAQQMPVDDKP